jgi:hypothetical protein
MEEGVGLGRDHRKDRPAGSRELARASVGGCQGWGFKCEGFER